MGLKGLLVVSIPVGDQERAKRFYVDRLGFEVVQDAPFEMDGQEMCWVEAR